MLCNYSNCSESFLDLVKYTLKSNNESDFTSFVKDYLPIPNKFNVFDIEDKAIPSPFSEDTTVSIPVIEGKEKTRTKLTRSVRKFSPTKNQILPNILNPPAHLDSIEARTQFLIKNARILCETTAASYLDIRFPKFDPEIVSKSFSDFHQKAVKKVKRRKVKEKVYDVKEDVKEKVVASSTSIEFEKKLNEIFSEIKPIPELSQPLEGFWQWNALKSLQLRKKFTPPTFWKRTPYPPKTKEEKLQELRNKSQKEDKQIDVDILSGVWDPTFMVPEFKITGINYECGLEEEHIQQIDWETLQIIKKKCDDWLELHKEFL